MPFERFEKPGERFSTKISVWKQGVIHVSKGTMNYFALEGLDYCSLHYDREARKVGLQFISSSEMPGTIKLSHRDVGAVIPAKSFFDFYQISYNPSRQYQLEQDPRSGLLVFDLGAPIEGYEGHPDAHFVEKAFHSSCSFRQRTRLGLTSEEEACIGRYLFDAGIYLNWTAEDMSSALEELMEDARNNQMNDPPRIPQEKKVFDLLREKIASG